MRNRDRRKAALDVRVSAAELAAARPHPRHVANGDEQSFRRIKDGKNAPSYLATFTKGMAHDFDTGLVSEPADVQSFIKAIDSGDPRDFLDTPLGPAEPLNWRSRKARDAAVRAWESQGAGSTFDLEGPDAQAVTMPPPPPVGSLELIAEMGEVYAQALLRDVPFTSIVDLSGAVKTAGKGKKKGPRITVEKVRRRLNELSWFADEFIDLSPAERGRKRGTFNGQTLFRGITPGDDIGPYISQFLLAGDKGINRFDRQRLPADGLLSYGALTLDQRVRFARPGDDHMTAWKEWYDVQQGADLRGLERYESSPARRFITTPRDLATYVHYDALYEAYLNACLLLLGLGVPFDPGLPFQDSDGNDHQQGFAHFGGPHILSLVTEVATRALKAVRFQKFNVHRRARPEVLAARITRHKILDIPEVSAMAAALAPFTAMVNAVNPKDRELGRFNALLPMAYCEGSPMHPSYGAGHATVAGACVTILKAFFDHGHPLAAVALSADDPGDPRLAYVARYDARERRSFLEPIPVVDAEGAPASLTVEGELNKLASNIAIGRDWAGVHYFSDYVESIRMGEQVAIGILEEQKLTYGENFSMTVPLFDGGSIRI